MKTELPNAAVKHVVVLMLENRGFDHIMGWLYGPTDLPLSVVGAGGGGPFDGLSMLSPQALQALENPSPLGGTVPINKGARAPRSPSFNTGESFPHIFNQMWDGTTPSDVWKDPAARAKRIGELQTEYGQIPPMIGYVGDYAMDVAHHCKVNLNATQLSEALDTYLPVQMPVLSGLARYYAVSDQWFCSVPSQTNTNRAFSMTGTSRGMVSNSFYDPATKNPGIKFLKSKSEGVSNADALPVSTRSLFEVLEQENFAWKYYFQDYWPPQDFALSMKWQYTRTMIPLLGNSQFDDNFVLIDMAKPNNQLFQDIENGQLPALTWIEPRWGGGPRWDTKLRAVGNDYHPACDTTTGEDFVASLYNALTAGPQWKNTLFIITFDENGGTYDHVPPPPALPSGLDGSPLPVPTDWKHMDPETRTQYGFKFDQYGVRVPTLLISPRIGPGLVFRSSTGIPFDHTSMIATILTLAGIDRSQWELGARTDNAPTFETLVQGQLRTDILNPAAALRVPSDQPPDPASLPLYSNTPYVFEYIGNTWGATASARCYLGPSTKGNPKMPSYYFPTLVGSKDEAVQFTLVSDSGPDQRTPIMNMSILKIMTTEKASWLTNFVLMTVNNELPWVYYGNNGGTAGARWQIRLLNSRDPADVVSTGDRVYFVSRLEPHLVQSAYSRTTPDPLKRLIPLGPDDEYLTTLAGEWALWRITPVTPPTPEELV